MCSDLFLATVLPTVLQNAFQEWYLGQYRTGMQANLDDSVFYLSDDHDHPNKKNMLSLATSVIISHACFFCCIKLILICAV